MKTQNYKLVDLTKGYNFDRKCIFIWHNSENDIIFLLRQVLLRDYYTAKILYEFFVHLNDPKCKNSKLQSCRPLWGLQFLCKMYLHLKTYRKDIIFLIRQALIRGYYAPEILLYFFEHLNVLKWKTQNYKVVDLIKG
jgi:hypothetical protein